jgi:hypothetical protein
VSPEPAQVKEAASVSESEPEKSEQVEETGSVGRSEPGDPVQIEKHGSVSASEIAEPAPGGHTGLPLTRTDQGTRR